MFQRHMIYQLMKRDPAWRLALPATLVGPVSLVGWHFLRPADSGPTSFGEVSTLTWAFACLAIGAGQAASVQQGDTRFLAALPITVRQIFTARVLSLLVLLWLPVIASAAIIVAFGQFADAAAALTLVEFASVWTLMMLGIQSVGMQGFMISPRWSIVLPITAFTSWTAFSRSSDSVLLPFNGTVAAVAPFLLGCWLLSAAVFFWTWRVAPFLWVWRAVPNSFPIAPSKPSPKQLPPADTADRARIGIGSVVTTPWKPVLRSIFGWGGILLYAFFVPTTGAGWAFGLLLVMSQWIQARPRIHWLLALPISARTLLGIVLAPILLAIAGGSVLAVHLPWYPRSSGIEIRISSSQGPLRGSPGDDSCKMLNITPPTDYWVPLAKSESAPLIRSPWGETFQPSTYRLYGFDVFNPYAVGCGNSQQFFDWQFARATEATYGRPVSRAEYERLGHGLSTMVITRFREQAVSIFAMLGLVLSAMLLMLLDSWNLLRRLPRPARFIPLFFLGAAVVAGMFLSPELNIAQWLSWALPANVPFAMSLLAVTLAALYWGIDKLFRQAEFADKLPSPAATGGFWRKTS